MRNAKGLHVLGALGRAFLCALPIAAVAAAAQGPQPAVATIEIDAGRVEGRISPLLYGQFIEYMFEGIKGGLYAELLEDRGFEAAPNAIGLPRGWSRYPDDRNDDYGISFVQDDETAYPSAEAADGGQRHSLRVKVQPAVIDRHGLYQARIPVMGGLEYRGSVWLKTDAFNGEVRVSLEADAAGGRVYAETPVAVAGGDWKQYRFALKPVATDALARFAILVTGTGTAWIDQVSLMPGDAVGGVRADVHARVKALAPAFIRWPGGNVAQDYHWKWGIGPRDERPTWINLSWKNEIEPSDFGTGELVAFARSVGAEPSITVNVEGRGATVEEAAAWVEYCNGPPSSTNGTLRARNGHEAPYGVKYWEVGNEIWGDWVRGHSDAATYARNLSRYATAMRAVDPSIRLIAVGDNDMAWNRTVLGAGTRIDYLAIHHYYGRKQMDGDLRNLMARPLHYERFYGEVGTVIRELPEDRRPQLAINEWGLDLPESQQYSILGALYGARLMNVFERQGDLVGMSAVSDLVNGWPGGIIQASRHDVFVTPVYLVNRLYATHVGAERLAATVDGPVFSSSHEGTNVPSVDVVATRTADGRRIYLKAVNTDLQQPVSARISLRGATIAAPAVVERVVADSPNAANGFRTPDAVHVTRDSIAIQGATLTLTLPKHSVTVVTFDVQ
jgi:alpha-N-arabinofuranosidase